MTKPFDFEEVRLRLCIHLKTTTPETTEENTDTEQSVHADSNTSDVVLFQATRRLLPEKLDTTLGLAELVLAVNTNPRRLNAAFRQCVGVTVFEFLREERMKEARRLFLRYPLEPREQV